MKPIVEIWNPDWKCTIEADEMRDLTKHKTWRSDKYLEWVKTQPSCISGQPADDFHHIKGHGMGGTVKAPDWAVIPLTREEHSWFHSPAGGCITWEKTHGNQLEHVARILGRALEEGVLILKTDIFIAKLGEKS